MFNGRQCTCYPSQHATRSIRICRRKKSSGRSAYLKAAVVMVVEEVVVVVVVGCTPQVLVLGKYTAFQLVKVDFEFFFLGR